MINYVYWVHLPDQAISEGYIGVTADVQRRWKEHKTKLNCLHLANAITLYQENLIWEVVFKGSVKDCYLLEQYLRYSPNMGWNIAQGGKVSNNLGRKMSFVTKEKLSKSKQGSIPWNKDKTNIYTKETLQKIGDATKRRTQGKDNPMYGKTHTKETKEKISKVHKGKEGMKGHLNPSAKKVVCIETNKIFMTISEAAASVNITLQALSAHLNGKTKKSGGYTWKYF